MINIAHLSYKFRHYFFNFSTIFHFCNEKHMKLQLWPLFVNLIIKTLINDGKKFQKNFKRATLAKEPPNFGQRAICVPRTMG